MPIAEETATTITVDAEVIPPSDTVKLYRKDKGEVDVLRADVDNYIKNGEWKEVR